MLFGAGMGEPDRRAGNFPGQRRWVRSRSGRLPEKHVEAIAVSIASLLGTPDETASAAARAIAEDAALEASEDPAPHASMQRGARDFLGKCANGHRAKADPVPPALATGVGPEPQNFLRIVPDGVTPDENAFFVRPMPGPGKMSAEDHADLAGFVRRRRASGPWPNLGDAALGVRARAAGRALRIPAAIALSQPRGSDGSEAA